MHTLHYSRPNTSVCCVVCNIQTSHLNVLQVTSFINSTQAVLFSTLMNHRRHLRSVVVPPEAGPLGSEQAGGLKDVSIDS